MNLLQKSHELFPGHKADWQENRKGNYFLYCMLHSQHLSEEPGFLGNSDLKKKTHTHTTNKP